MIEGIYTCWQARGDIALYFSGAETEIEQNAVYDRIYDHIIRENATVACELCLACWNKYRRQQEQATKEQDPKVIKG